MYVYWKNESYGHLNQVRADLEVSYKGQQQFINVSGGAILDTMWVESEKNQGKNNAPAVMMCNPNGVFYENLALFDDSFLNLFLQNGFNVFLWNYRGYGRSTGSISPDNVLKDADNLVEYLINIRGVTKLLVHGSSLGGAVAAHCSNNPNVEAVF